MVLVSPEKNFGDEWNYIKVCFILPITIWVLFRDKTKNIFFYLFTELKTYHLSYSFYKHGAIDIANPSRMQAACHMNFVIDLTHLRVSVVEHQSIGARNPRV